MAEYSAQPVNGMPQNGETGQQTTRGSNDRFELISGPLINLKNMHYQATTTWHGSILIVTKPTQEQPQLRLRQVSSSTRIP
ncbi:hypothetical protein DTO012A8_9877 [Penicillium roqueforti]|nr:hypothetical protein DTO012A8_9877 [Penicillium roqueforti]